MKRALKSRPLQIAVSFVLAAGLLALFVRGLDVAEIGRQISAASGGWLLASVLLAITTFLLRALRWTWLLRPVARVPFYPAFVATAFGFAANNLPGKVGEVLRPALLARSRGLPFSPLLASVLLERVFDGAAVLFFFAWRDAGARQKHLFGATWASVFGGQIPGAPGGYPQLPPQY